MAFGPIALLIGALFTGAAFYVGFAEHPARLHLDDRNALTQWKPSYHRGYLMQASLAIAGFLAALAAWFQDDNWMWLAGGLFLLANWPFTLFAILPTNSKLMATPPDAADASTRDLLVRWGGLHAVRTLLGTIATATFLWMMI